jgi:hypothetical protein
MPVHSHRTRHAKYSGSPEVTLTPRVAASVRTFDGATLADHLRDRMNITDGRPVKANIRLYQVLPGTTAAHIARAEGIQPQDLHPLTHEAAGALLGRNAALASRGASAHGLHCRSRLHKRQRLYYIEPPGGPHHRHRHHRHSRIARSELLINLTKGEIILWLYLSEALCQQVSAQLAKGQAVPAFRLVKPLVHRAAEMVRLTVLERKLPPHLRVIGDKPNLDARVPTWISGVGKQLADKIEEWASQHVAGYIESNAAEFRRGIASDHDGGRCVSHDPRSRIRAACRTMSQRKTPPGSPASRPSRWMRTRDTRSNEHDRHCRPRDTGPEAPRAAPAQSLGRRRAAAGRFRGDGSAGRLVSARALCRRDDARRAEGGARSAQARSRLGARGIRGSAIPARPGTRCRSVDHLADRYLQTGNSSTSKSMRCSRMVDSGRSFAPAT